MTSKTWREVGEGGRPQPVKCRVKDRSRYGSETSKWEALTGCQAQSEGQVKIWKEISGQEALTTCQAQNKGQVKMWKEMSKCGELTHCQAQSEDQVKILKKRARQGGHSQSVMHRVKDRSRHGRNK